MEMQSGKRSNGFHLSLFFSTEFRFEVFSSFGLLHVLITNVSRGPSFSRLMWTRAKKWRHHLFPPRSEKIRFDFRFSEFSPDVPRERLSLTFHQNLCTYGISVAKSYRCSTFHAINGQMFTLRSINLFLETVIPRFQSAHLLMGEENLSARKENRSLFPFRTKRR